MLHLVYSITHPCINTTELHNVTCTLVATGVILRSLECIASLARSSILACAVAHSISGGFGRSEMYSGCRSQQSTEPAQLTEEAEIYTRCTFQSGCAVSRIYLLCWIAIAPLRPHSSLLLLLLLFRSQQSCNPELRSVDFVLLLLLLLVQIPPPPAHLPNLVNSCKVFTLWHSFGRACLARKNLEVILPKSFELERDCSRVGFYFSLSITILYPCEKLDAIGWLWIRNVSIRVRIWAGKRYHGCHAEHVVG